MKIFKLQFLSFLLVVGLLLSCSKHSDNFSIEQTTCNFKELPSGVENTFNLGWKIHSELRNQQQAAYQILISDNTELLNKDEGNIWNSGKVESNVSVNVLVDKLVLESGKYYFWKVKIWNAEGFESGWSKPAKFITALYSSDWGEAKWISMEEMNDSSVLVPGIPTWGHNTKNIAKRRPIVPLFRNEFIADKKIQSALLFISGLGHYKAYINGSQISTDFMSPGWTHYHKTCLYNTYDVTENVLKGENAIGILVGTGFYNINNERYRKMLITYGMPKTIAKLKIKYTDGTTKTIVTGDDWKVAPSPITYSSIYGGESYDARLEQKDWNKAGFDDANWNKALLAKLPGGQLKPDINYPVTKVKTFSPVEVIQKGLDTFAFDFGQNASAIVEIQLKGKKGDTVRIYPSELIYEKLRENQRWTGWPHYYEYVLKGEGIETWSPMFTYYGMRYAHVTGAQPTEFYTNSTKPEIVDIKMHHISNSAPQVGSFWCSNPLFNQIDTLIRYGIKSNLQSVMTDCPHRERLGWIEQTYLMGNSVKFNYEVYHLYSKLIGDMMDSQRDNGLIGNMAPEFIVFGDVFTDSPEWGSAIIQVPWLVYKNYGDVSLIQKAWENMKRYLKYLDSKADEFIISYGLGDWYDLGPKAPGFSQLSPLATTATSIYYLDYKVMAEMAKIVGKVEEEKAFRIKAEEIKKAYNKLLFNPKTGIYASGSQTAMAIPLSMGIVEDEFKNKVLWNLIDSIEKNDKAMTAGDIGFHYLIDALTNEGHSWMIYEMNNRDDIPGYGYQIKKGATALTESWDALDNKSNNHLMLGHIEEWFYKGLGGIRQEDSSVAYKNIIIKPSIVEGLEEVKTKYESPYGTIKIAWKNTEKVFTMNVSIPVNTKAIIFISSSQNDAILESNTPLDKISEINILESTPTYTKIQVGSGDYEFRVIKD